MKRVIREKRRSVSENSPMPVGALGGDHLLQHALVLLGAGLDHAPAGELRRMPRTRLP